jgi:Fe-S-cluster-containing hydrogenase component 2
LNFGFIILIVEKKMSCTRREFIKNTSKLAAACGAVCLGAPMLHSCLQQSFGPEGGANSKYYVRIKCDIAHCNSECLAKCSEKAIEIRDGKAEILTDKCNACGECVQACPHDAINPTCYGWNQLGSGSYAARAETGMCRRYERHCNGCDLPNVRRPE